MFIRRIIWHMFVFGMLCRFTLCSFAQVHFDGSTNYIYCGNYDTAPPFTFSAWVFPEDLNTTDNLIMGEQYHRQFDFNDGDELRLYEDSANPKSYTYPINSNEFIGVWTHVAASMSTTNVCLYINGRQVTHTAVLTPQSGLQDLYVGAAKYAGNMVRHFDGVIDDARAYSRVLTPEEIAEIYARPWSLTDDPSLLIRTAIPGKWDHGAVLDALGPNIATNHGATLSQTANGWEASFDATDDYLLTGMYGPLGSSNRTLTAWLKTTNTVSLYNMLAFYGANAAGQRFWWNIESNEKLGLRIHTGSVVFNAPGIADDSFHHVAVVVTSSSLLDVAMYLDGVSLSLVSSNTANTINTGEATPITIGAQQWDGSPHDYFDGIMRSVTVYDHALASNDIAVLASNANITNTPLARWTMQPAYLSTYSKLKGTAKNYGSAPNCSYRNDPVAGTGMVRHRAPRRASAGRVDDRLLDDVSGNGYTATNHGATLFETASDWAATFSCIVTTHADAGMSGTVSSNCTVIVRFQTTDWSSRTGGMLLFCSRDVSDSLYRRFFIQPTDYGGPAGSYYFQVQTTGGSSGVNTSGTFTFADYTQYCIAGVLRNQTTLELYVNGIRAATGSIPASYIINDEALIGAGYDGVQAADCIMYDVQWYPEEALSSNDIYTVSSGGSITSTPAAHWTMQPFF